MACMACAGPVFDSSLDGSMGNAYKCSTHVTHVHCCIVCAYTYFRTRLLNDEPIICYDPLCTRAFTLNEQLTIAKCSLNADEFQEFSKQLEDRLLKRGEEPRNLALEQVKTDSLDNIKYAAKHCKRCPDCLVRVEKADGCDDVQCQNCGSRFEYSEAFNYLDHDELKRRESTNVRRSSRRLREVVRLTYFQSS